MSRWGLPCIAITARGTVCGRPHRVELPVLFEWDPVAGRGYGGVNVTLCRLHDYLWELEPHERVEVLGGWLGRGWNPEGKCWTVNTCAYESRTSEFASKHWYQLSRPIRAGVCDDVTYHEAVERLAKIVAERATVVVDADIGP